MLKRQSPWGSAFEGLEPRLLAGNVLATLSHGVLTIAGDADNNEIRITQAGANTFQIAGLTGTTVNGLAAGVFGGVTKKISVKGDGGNDTVTVNEINFAGKLSIAGGSGNDTVVVLGSPVAGKVILNGGKDVDALTILASPFGKLKNKAFENFNFAAPVVTSSATANVAENTTAVQTLTATDADVPAQAITWSITGGADQALFNITGGNQLVFITAPNFEAPTDAGANNVYNVQVTANDGMSGLTARDVAVTVTDVNEAPVVADQSFLVDPAADNYSPVGTVLATDPEGAALTYTIIAGDPNGTFGIENPLSGVISVIDNTTLADHSLTVRVSDGVNQTDATVSIVLNVPPVFTSSAAPNVPENTTAVVTLTATDANVPAQTITYAITGGADAASFTITGGNQLAFITAPDFEAPTDAGANNVYNVSVTASDGAGGNTVQALAVTVTAVNDNNPVFTSSATPNTAENTTAVVTVNATDADLPAQVVTYSITGGADAAKFNIVGATGVLTFITAPDFEAPTDANLDNVYLVQVTANDGAGLTTVQNLSVTVTPVEDNNPVFTSSAAPSVAENTTAVVTVTATDADLPAQTVTYSIVGGADAAKFNIVGATGVLTFITAPDFEVPTDAGADNVYNVTVRANDGSGGTTDQALAVTVTPVNEFNPVITSAQYVNVAENTTAVVTVTATDADLPAQTLGFSITGGADAAFFSINATTGALAFLVAPDFEAPADANVNNVYLVQVTVSDGAGGLTDQTVWVTVTPVNDNAPVFTSSATPSVAENTTAVVTVAATDDDLPAQTVTYSITGGADAALFGINGATGALAFLVAPDFEIPTDADTDNAYLVQVTADDGAGSTTVQNLTITVTDVVEP